MKKENYRDLKEIYTIKVEEQERIKRAKKELAELEQLREQLEQNPLIKQYLGVLIKINNRADYLKDNKSFSDDDLLQQVESNYIPVENTSGIYVCMGAYDYRAIPSGNQGSGVVRVQGEKDYFYKIYRNLEMPSSKSDFHVHKNDCSNFEKFNVIIHAEDMDDPELFFESIKQKYFRNLLTNSQEDAFDSISEYTVSGEGYIKK